MSLLTLCDVILEIVKVWSWAKLKDFLPWMASTYGYSSQMVKQSKIHYLKGTLQLLSISLRLCTLDIDMVHESYLVAEIIIAQIQLETIMMEPAL